MTAPILCPACAGPSMSDHPAGSLGGWTHAPDCLLGAHEDGRAAADSDALLDVAAFVRDSTEAERILLETLGFVGADIDTLKTAVRGITPGVRHRSWPQLRSPAPTPEG